MNAYISHDSFNACQNSECPFRVSGCAAKDTCPRYTGTRISTYTSNNTQVNKPTTGSETDLYECEAIYSTSSTYIKD